MTRHAHVAQSPRPSSTHPHRHTVPPRLDQETNHGSWLPPRLDQETNHAWLDRRHRIVRPYPNNTPNTNTNTNPTTLIHHAAQDCQHAVLQQQHTTHNRRHQTPPSFRPSGRQRRGAWCVTMLPTIVRTNESIHPPNHATPHPVKCRPRCKGACRARLGGKGGRCMGQHRGGVSSAG